MKCSLYRNPNNLRVYSLTSNYQRQRLLHMIKEENMSLQEASDELKINFSTAKTILRVYKRENRILKKNNSKKKMFYVEKNIQRKSTIECPPVELNKLQGNIRDKESSQNLNMNKVPNHSEIKDLQVLSIMNQNAQTINSLQNLNLEISNLQEDKLIGIFIDMAKKLCPEYRDEFKCQMKGLIDRFNLNNQDIHRKNLSAILSELKKMSQFRVGLFLDKK